jgi:hypothetical protein
MKKIITVILVLALMTTFVIPASAFNFDQRVSEELNEVSKVILELQDEFGVLQIVSEELPNGDVVLTQYLNGVVNDVAFIDNNGLEDDGLEDASDDFFSASSFLQDGNTPILRAGSAMLGTINYVALTGSGTVRYGLKVHCSESYPIQTTYVINGWVGSVVNLLSVLSSGLSIPTFVASSALSNILANAGINVVGGSITTALSTTVASLRTTYSYTVTDKANTSHQNTATSYRYDVNDQTYHTNGTYYDGYSPADWRSTAMGLWFHNMLFAYSNFSIESWQ